MGGILTIISVIALPVILYALWTNGYMTANMKRAILYVGSKGKNRRSATIYSCTGVIKSVLSFKESRVHKFNFTSTLNAGDVIVEIQDKNKNIILLLGSVNGNGILEIDKTQRYYLVFKHKKASGKYQLNWE